MMSDLLHRRDDGTFVIRLNGNPYHVTHDDPLYPEVAAAAEGVDLPPETVPMPPEADADLLILSVLPVALRKALRNTPAPLGGGDALAYVLGVLASPGLEDARDAFEYMVRAERADMIALGGPLGFDAEAVDAVLALAATYPGSDARWGQAPTAA
jgi:hypothetical protein